MREYEGLFLVDEAKASEAPQETIDHIRGLLERRGAKITKLEKWDTMRLAYEIEGKKRGTYFVGKFEANPAEILELRRDCELSGTILRAMILREENVGVTVQIEDNGRPPRERSEEPEEIPETEIAGDTEEKA